MGRKPVTYWKYVDKLDEKRVKCKLCQHEFDGSGSRITAHLRGILKRGVKVCSQSSQFLQLESVNGCNERDITNEAEVANDSHGKAKTTKAASVKVSNKRAKTVASSREHGWPTSICNRVNEYMQIDEEKGEGRTYQQVDVNKETNQEELLPFNVTGKGLFQIGPFRISYPVDADDLKLIQYAFDKSLDPSEVVVSSSCSFLNRSEFGTLEPGGFLDAMVINIVALNLTCLEWKKQNKRLNWYLPILFSSSALAKETEFREFVEKHKIRETYMPGRLVDCDKIFIPIHIGQHSGGHFYLYVVDMRSRVVEIWDSYPSYTRTKEREENARKLLRALDNLFLDDIENNYSEGWAFAGFNIVMMDIPTQPNRYDCGIFVIKFMKTPAAMRDPTIKFQSDEERLVLALGLLKDDMNSERETLLEKAKRNWQQNQEDNQHVDRCHATVLPSIPEKLQCKKPEGSATLNLPSCFNRLDQFMQLLKENLKELTCQENFMRKKFEEVGSLHRSKVENWLENVERIKNQVPVMEEGVKRLVEEVGQLVREKIPESLTLGDHELINDPSETTELKSIYANLDCKQCFLHSAFYPENREISREELIQYFVDEGLIDGTKSLDAQFTEGHTILDELENNFLLKGGYFDQQEQYRKSEDGDEDYYWLKGGVIDPKVKWVKMSGASRVLALDIMNESSGFIVEAGLKLSAIPLKRNWAEVEKVSLMCNLIKEIPWGTSVNCPKLSTLILQQNPLTRISDTFFSHMPALEVLDLSYTDIEHLPKSISDLKTLISLLLRSCQKLKDVPPLGNLESLARLDLSRTAITAVPEGLEKMVNLRWLSFYKSRLLEIDPGLLIPKLTNLQHLELDCNASGFMKVKAEHLEGLKKLETFVGNLYDARNYNSYVKTIQTMDCRLKRYCLQLGTGNPWNPTSGKAVVFVNCKIMTMRLPLVLPVDVQQLYLAACNRWSRVCEVFSFNFASSLKYIEIFECRQMENLFCFSDTCSFCSSLQNLEVLNLNNLDKLSLLWKEEAAAPPLSLSYGKLSGLRFLKVAECDKIKKLFTPALLANLQNLEIVHVKYCASIKEIFSVADMNDMGEENSGGNLPGNNNNNNNNNTGDLTTFSLPKLVSLVLWDLPELSSVCRGKMHCDCLKEFKIALCPSLETLPDPVPWVEIEIVD